MTASKQRQETAVDRAAKIFAILRAAADRNEPCPTNMTLGTRFGVSCQVISRALEFLEGNGMISVFRGSNYRLVRITATGKMTARPANLYAKQPRSAAG